MCGKPRLITHISLTFTRGPQRSVDEGLGASLRDGAFSLAAYCDRGCRLHGSRLPREPIISRSRGISAVIRQLSLVHPAFRVPTSNPLPTSHRDSAVLSRPNHAVLPPRIALAMGPAIEPWPRLSRRQSTSCWADGHLPGPRIAPGFASFQRMIDTNWMINGSPQACKVRSAGMSYRGYLWMQAL